MNGKKTAICMLMVSLAATSAAFAASDVMAKPSTMQVTLNGTPVGLSGYEIEDNNYFKLRDVAYALRETNSRFSVDFDGKTISLASGTPYTAVGGEMTVSGTDTANAMRKDDALFINQKSVTLTAYEIGGYNYFKLRDLGDALDFDVDFDEDSRTVILQAKEQESVPSDTAMTNPGYQDAINSNLAVEAQPDVMVEIDLGEFSSEEQRHDVSDAHAVLALMNAARAAEGASALKLDDDLCKAAQIRAEELQELFDHTRPNGTKCFTILEDIGWSNGYSALGENIAMGQTTPEIVMDSWMNSQGHRENILNTDFNKVGIARHQNGWVQFFLG